MTSGTRLGIAVLLVLSLFFVTGCSLPLHAKNESDPTIRFEGLTSFPEKATIFWYVRFSITNNGRLPLVFDIYKLSNHAVLHGSHYFYEFKDPKTSDKWTSHAWSLTEYEPPQYVLLVDGGRTETLWVDLEVKPDSLPTDVPIRVVLMDEHRKHYPSMPFICRHAEHGGPMKCVAME